MNESLQKCTVFVVIVRKQCKHRSYALVSPGYNVDLQLVLLLILFSRFSWMFFIVVWVPPFSLLILSCDQSHDARILLPGTRKIVIVASLLTLVFTFHILVLTALMLPFYMVWNIPYKLNLFIKRCVGYVSYF